jgi:hypothetical protein
MLPDFGGPGMAQNEIHQTLPKSCAVCVQWKRCGRAGCRCTYGLLHGPYYCLFWRIDGRLRKRYVRLPEGPALQAAYRQQREQARERRETARHAHAEWRALRAWLREMEREWRT